MNTVVCMKSNWSFCYLIRDIADDIDCNNG